MSTRIRTLNCNARCAGAAGPRDLLPLEIAETASSSAKPLAVHGRRSNRYETHGTVVGEFRSLVSFGWRSFERLHDSANRHRSPAATNDRDVLPNVVGVNTTPHEATSSIDSYTNEHMFVGWRKCSLYMCAKNVAKIAESLSLRAFRRKASASEPHWLPRARPTEGAVGAAEHGQYPPLNYAIRWSLKSRLCTH
jgi:hypothetical protein